MRKSISNYVLGLNAKKFTTNNQIVLYTLLKKGIRGDGWVSSRDFKVPTGQVRVRELRCKRSGGFGIECKTASDLDRAAAPGTYFYRIVQRSLTVARLRKIFDQ